jgi:transposase
MSEENVGRVERLLNLLANPEARLEIDRLHLHSGSLAGLLTETLEDDATGPIRRKQQRRLDAEEQALVIAAYQTGLTVYEVAKRHQIGRHTLSAILARQGVPRRRNGLNPEQISEARALYSDGWSTARIAEHFEVDGNTVLRALTRAGVRLRDSHGRGNVDSATVVPMSNRLVGVRRLRRSRPR